MAAVSSLKRFINFVKFEPGKKKAKTGVTAIALVYRSCRVKVLNTPNRHVDEFAVRTAPTYTIQSQLQWLKYRSSKREVSTQIHLSRSASKLLGCHILWRTIAVHVTQFL